MKEYTIARIQELMKEGKLTAKKLVKDYLQQIKTIDQAGPRLNAIIEINPLALVIAEKLDDERKQNKLRGPLHGIPIVLKDNINTGDKMMTTAGSLALGGHQAREDAFIVSNLRKAGAIILAKANLSEWANFRSTRSSSGWSSRGGQTLNPYVLDRSPCGSSSGSAVAVAANLCAVAIGTETDGSIICPAHMNGVVGIKPTVGLVSRTGIIPISHNQDTAGPFARTVEDAAILLGAMVGRDQQDEKTTSHKEKFPLDYTQYLDINGLEGMKIGIARTFFGFNPDVDNLMNQAIQKMKVLGAEIIDPVEFEKRKELSEPELTVLLYDFKNDLNAYLKKYSTVEKITSMQDIIDYNNQNKEKVMPYFGQEIFLKAIEKGPLTDKEYLEALDKCQQLSRKEGIDKALQTHNLDAIAAPSGSPAWTIDLINGDHFSGGSSSLAAVSGYPNITVPLGYVFGLPVGISFFGGAFREGKLLKIAYAFEQATKIRQKPTFLPTLELVK